MADPLRRSRADTVDLELRQRARDLERGLLTFCALAQEAINGGYCHAYGYHDPESYFEERIGVSYRTVRRRLAVLEAVHGLPEAAQEPALVALSELGGTKAAILAPALRQEPERWQSWVRQAAAARVAAVQDQVNRLLGRVTRPEAPGDRFLAYVLNQCPEDSREEVRECFALGAKLAETENAVAIFLALVRETLQEWRAR